MENRISIRTSTPTAAPTQPLASRGTKQDVGAPPVASPQDAVRLSGSTTGSELADLRALIVALTERLDALEGAVSQREQVAAPASAQVPPGVNLPPLATQTVAPPAQERVVIDPAAWRDVPMEAVQVALGTAKLENLTPAEKKTVERALERVRQIGIAIHRGEHPGPLQAELFALKQTLAAPAGAGRNTVATSGAQLLAQVDTAKTRLTAAILSDEKAGMQGTKDPAQVQVSMLRMYDSYRALVQIERLLFSLNVADLPPEKQRAVLQEFSALRDVASQIDGRKLEGTAADSRIAQIGARLQELAPAHGVTQSQRSASDAITRNKLSLQEQLRALDEKQFAGTPPEAVAGERARLLAAAEALVTLGEAVSSAKPQGGSAAERREVENALKRATSLADALGRGQHPGDIRNALFVTAQSLKDPIGSQTNPSIQATAGALQVMGLAEVANAKARGEISAAISQGADPRTQDVRAAQLARQAEDLEAMRRNLETVNYAGLTPAKAPQATAIIGQMQAIAQRVADGEDYAKHRGQYEKLGKQLRELAQAGAAPAPAPPVAPVTPPAAPTAPAGPAPAKPRTYTVKSGDYLVKIAREQLGDGNRWRELVELNQDQYPSLKTNPGLIHPNWKLKLPPREPQAAPATPASSTPAGRKPPANSGAAVAKPNEPAAKEMTELDAVAWLRAKADGQGRVTRAVVDKMPDSSAKTWLQAHFDTLIFGATDPGKAGWESLHKGDLDRLEQALRAGGTIHGYAESLAGRVVEDHRIEDLTFDGVADGADVSAYVAAQRRNVGGTGEASPTQAAPNLAETRARADLAGFLAVTDNRQPEVLRSAIQNSPDIFKAATPEQKAEVAGYLMAGFTGKDNRTAALKVMEFAAERGELGATLEAAGKTGTLKNIFTDMGDHSAGVRMARLLVAARAYENPAVWRAMDDDAVRAFLKALDFKRPMIGTNVTLQGLSEEARHRMIGELTQGHVTPEELDMAKWINLHNVNKVEIREFENAADSSNF